MVRAALQLPAGELLKFWLAVVPKPERVQADLPLAGFCRVSPHQLSWRCPLTETEFSPAVLRDEEMISTVLALNSEGCRPPVSWQPPLPALSS